MDELGVATGVFTGGLDRNTEKLLDDLPTRTRAASSSRAGSATRATRPRNVKRIRELAQHPRFAMVRVMPLASQVPTNDARHYPMYQVCEELGHAGRRSTPASPARACAHACSTPSCSRTC